MKRYVPVVLWVDETGRRMPRIIEFEGRKYVVERVLDVSRAVCYPVGSKGVRYTCVIHGKRAELWEEQGCWFVLPKR